MEPEFPSLDSEPLPPGEALEVQLSHNQAFLRPMAQAAVLNPHTVEIQVLASEVPSLGGSKILVAGEIIKAGDQVSECEVVGKRAIAFIPDRLKTVARSSLFVLVEGSSYSNEELIGVLEPLIRIVDLTLTKSTIQPGDSVVVLPGPELMMRLLTRLAIEFQWRLIILTTPDEKCPYKPKPNSDTALLLDVDQTMRHIHREEEDGRQVIVLAHQFDALGQEIWREMGGLGRFLLMHNDASPLEPDPLPFKRGASFTAVHEKLKPSLRLLKLALSLIKAHPALLHGVLTDTLEVVDISSISESAGSKGQQANRPKRVVKYSPGGSQIKVLRPLAPVRLLSDVTYLLVGCLGGLGRSLTRRMLELGARHFTFISRTGADKPEAARVIQAIHDYGASARVFRVDASDAEATRKAVTQANADRPIRGVIHAAMVLRDGMFEQMGYDSFMEAVIPKSRGAVAVHEALQSIPGVSLDFFVMTSSISALLGNIGQSNYSAANSVLDSIARFGSASRQPTISLVLPMVLDVGVVAQDDTIETSLARKGLYGIDEDEMLRGFEVAMSQARNASTTGSQIIMGMDPGELARAIHAMPTDNLDLYWIDDARFCHIKAAMETSQKTSKASQAKDSSFAEVLSATLKNEGREGALECIAQHIGKRVATILMLPIDSFELRGPSIASYGLDSMIGAELQLAAEVAEHMGV
ncbi:hypothetical protein ONZ43_g990 [Nemania bipapillata]|uniref:Uncharacterized protein n=1 Tax=Nemania bipapillata TaxID=110536 RepID=A0ACC2J648_9PEZI|nr:hypothetical protein ONZ43_g990 [Nemania bipapillata]